jgi:FkbM family methyltransferase
MMWFPHRVFRSGYAVLSRAGVFSTAIGQAMYKFLYENFKLAAEGGTIADLSDYIRHDSLVIDVGANIGIYTNVFIKSLGNIGKVIAIEADPANAASLRRRFRSLPCVDVIESIASDMSGVRRLHQDPYNPAGHVIGNDGIEVPSVTIDEVMDSYTLPLSLIKIDVEGAEPLVVQGAIKTIKKHMPVMFIEYSPERIAQLGGDSSGFLRMLGGLGYHFFVDDWHRPLSISEINQKALKKGYVDILFLAENVEKGN